MKRSVPAGTRGATSSFVSDLFESDLFEEILHTHLQFPRAARVIFLLLKIFVSVSAYVMCMHETYMPGDERVVDMSKWPQGPRAFFLFFFPREFC